MSGNSGSASAGTIVFAIDRVFNAPRERVWQAWTEAEQLKSWWDRKAARWKSAGSSSGPGASSTTR
jgi:uncharacterized protein YndB with AHSA1/START domain